MLKLKLQYFGHLMRRADSLEKTLILGKIEGGKRRGRQRMMVGWHRWLNGHEFEQAPTVGDGQESLACCSPWGRRELDTTEWLNWNGNFVPQSDTWPFSYNSQLKKKKKSFLVCVVKIWVPAHISCGYNIYLKIPRYYWFIHIINICWVM